MRHGVTLVELMVAVTVVALVIGVSATAFVPLRQPAPDSLHTYRLTATNHARAIRTWDSTGRFTLFLPDGRILQGGLGGGAP